MRGLPSYFYPRSPCGERQQQRLGCQRGSGISIHALLAESDREAWPKWPSTQPFLSTLSLRRATDKQHTQCIDVSYFYPRSPCGERRQAFAASSHSALFLSTLSLRRATLLGKTVIRILDNFYPRSPCGERPCPFCWNCRTYLFLSTLSLRRATAPYHWDVIASAFLSTLSLRRATLLSDFLCRQPIISIHALLAESDFVYIFNGVGQLVFLSTLSLRRATLKMAI